MRRPVVWVLLACPHVAPHHPINRRGIAAAENIQVV
jgi:hypothetical protein